MSISKTEIGESLRNLSKYAFLLTISIGALAITLDFFIVKIVKEVFLINLFSLILLIGVAVFYFFKKLSVNVSFAIVVYSLLLNICISNLMVPPGNYTAIFILRDTPPFLILLPLAGLIVNKKHALIIGGLYLLIYLLIILIKKNNFLLQNIATIYVIGIGYTYSMYFLINMLEKGLSKQDYLNKKISVQNQELIMNSNTLAEINKLLSVQTNEIRKQQQELFRLNATKDKMISLIAHDLKNPMATLIGFSEILSNRMDKLSPEKKKYYVDLVNNSAKSIFDLLENMLDWGRLQSEKILFNPEKINLHELVSPIMELLLPTAEQKKIKLKNLVNDEIIVFVDRHMMVAVFRNLMANALKFTNDYGIVEVKSCFTGDTVTISVEDNGVGMNTETLRSLFIANKTITNKGTAGEKGTGLGLLVCHEFLENHNSKIKVESIVGEGSIFSFELPFYNPKGHLF